MARVVQPVYSDYEVREMGIKVGEGSYEPADCVGSSEEALNVRRITKKCRGKVAKTRTKGTGDGTLKMKLHIPYSIYVKLYDMEREGLKEGVKAFGEDSLIPEISIVQKVLDEDNKVKYKAYPRAVVTTGPSRVIEAGAEEISEQEIELDLLPDEYGECMYEALESDLEDETIKTTWMESFTVDLVRTSI